MLVLQERDSNNIPLVTYTRGLDLSGTRQGAGGIGGLLALSDQKADASNPTNYFYHADGNGNIVALLNKKSEVVARYLYDPFGNLVAMSGPMASFNRYRFSSKEVHANSGLYYYGFRYYEPYLQRWLNQDPIGEAGGLNLYQFAGNDAINGFDPFGLRIYPEDFIGPLLPGDRRASGLFDIGYGLQILDEASGGPQYRELRDKYLGWVEENREAVPALAELADNLELAASLSSPSGLTKACPPNKGLQAAQRGRVAHQEFADKVKQKPGWKSEPTLTDPKTGKNVRPDAVTPSGRPVELKPATQSGRERGERQLKKYERATGKDGRVVYYDP